MPVAACPYGREGKVLIEHIGNVQHKKENRRGFHPPSHLSDIMIVTMILEMVAEIHRPLAASPDAAVNSVLPMVQESTRSGYQSQAK
jgi:hypothetical protein